MSNLTPEQIAKMPAHLRPANIQTPQMRAQALKDALTKKMEDYRNQVNAKSAGMFDDFDRAVPAASVKGKISEDIFVKYFLPMMIDSFADPKNTTQEYADFIKWRKKILNDWYMVAGGQWAEVEVIGAGEVLFTVPAMASSKMYNPLRDRNAPSATEIANLAGLRAQQSRDQLHSTVKQGLAVKYESMKKKGNIFEHEEKIWMDIRARYPDVKPLSVVYGFATDDQATLPGVSASSISNKPAATPAPAAKRTGGFLGDDDELL